MDTEPNARRGRFDRERTRQDILDAARQEFSEHGLDGARVEAIAARTQVVKRMIYYYFGSKEGLYVAVLEQAYADIRAAEQALALSDLDPVAAIAALVDFTFEYHQAHPDFIRLVSIENIHNAVHMACSEKITAVNNTILGMLSDILRRGQGAGLFRDDVDAVDVHMLISSFCFFRVANRSTFGLLFERDLADPRFRDSHKRLIMDAVLRSLVSAMPPRR